MKVNDALSRFFTPGFTERGLEDPDACVRKSGDSERGRVFVFAQLCSKGSHRGAWQGAVHS